MITVTVRELQRRQREILKSAASGATVTITRRGRPVVQMIPVPPASKKHHPAWNALAHLPKITGDPVSPLGEGDWEVCR